MPDTSLHTHGRFGTVWRYALSLAISLFIWTLVAVSLADRDADGPLAAWFLVADPALGLASFLLMRFRHRWPGAVGVGTGALSIVSTTAAGPASWMVGSLTLHRRWRLLPVVIPINIAAGVIQERIYPSGENALPLWASVLVGLLVMAVIVAVGYAMGSQRDLLASLRDRADTAEREQQARVAQAQSSERTRIAREMHDVLAHRISLVAMHAGALSYRTDLTPEEQATAARTIEDNAHHALRDLRDVLGVLRDPMVPTDAAPEQPQPVIADIARLVEEERASGMRVSLEEAITGELSDGRARTAYRIVQEALTNARKHAPGTSVTATLSGNPDDGLTITIRNAAPVGAHQSDLPDSGLGLIGLDERVGLAGGRLRHGPDATGGFVVEAWIPWQA